MEKQERVELKEIILKSIKETKDEIEQLKELTKPVASDNAIGRLSRMDAINNKSINDASLRENQSKLQKLERAIDKIENENFGSCAKCGDEIVFGRLKFMPWATKCVKCA